MAARESVLVIGRDELARDVVRHLVARGESRRVVLLSLTKTTPESERFLDPAGAGCARELADLLLEVRPTLALVVAFSSSPSTPGAPWTWDAALADLLVSAFERSAGLGCPVPRLIFLTSTYVYGVAPSSPLVFDERSLLPRESVFPSAQARWAEGLRRVERRLVAWAVAAGVEVGVLRTASVLAGPVDSPLAALLAAAVPVRVLGFDPPCQVIHYEDLVEALALAVEHGCGEVLNLVGQSVVPLSRLLAMAGVFAPAIPGRLADRLAPAGMDAAHLRWRTLADGRRATALLGFRPQRTLEDCLHASR